MADKPFNPWEAGEDAAFNPWAGQSGGSGTTYRYGPDGKRRPFKAGLEAAISGVTVGVPYAMEKILGEVTPEEDAEYRRKLRASAAKREELLPGGADGFDDIKERGLGAIPGALYETYMNSGPQMIASGVGGVIGGVAGTAAGPGPGNVVGAIAGAAAVGAPMFLGSNVDRATNSGEVPLTGEAAVRSAAVAPLQSVGEAAIGHFVPGIGKMIPGVPVAGGVGARVAKGVVGGAVTEGVTEVGQQAGERYAAGLPLGDASAREEYLAAGVMGGIGGGTIGGAGAPFRQDGTAPNRGLANPEGSALIGEDPVSLPPAVDTRTLIRNGLGPVETGNDPFQISEAGAVGRYQLLPSTAQRMANKLGVPFDRNRLLRDVEYNEMLASAYMDTLLQRYGGDQLKAVTAYHAGEGNVDKWIKNYGDPSEIGMDAWLDKIETLGESPRSAAYPRKVLGALGMADFGGTPVIPLADPFDMLGTRRPTGLDAIEVDSEGTARTGDNLLETAVPGSQGDLFGAPQPKSLLDMLPDNLSDDARASTNEAQTAPQQVDTPSLLTPEAEARSNVYMGADTVLQRLRAANANEDGTLGKTDAFTAKIANAITSAIREGSPQKADRFLAEQNETLAAGKLSAPQLDKRAAVLAAADQLVSDYKRSLTNEYAGAALNRATPAQVQEPVASVDPGTEGAVAQELARNTAAAEREGRAAQATQEQADFERQLEIANEIGEQSILNQTKDVRRAVLEEVLADPETRNPTRRFLKELKARGHKYGGITQEEANTIARFEDAREAFTSDQPDPRELASAPDESGGFGIRGQGEPRTRPTESTNAQAPAVEPAVAPEQPATDSTPQAQTQASNDVTPVRTRAAAQADTMGSTRRNWFLKGADAALNLSQDKPRGPTQTKAFAEGRAFVEREQGIRQAEQQPAEKPPAETPKAEDAPRPKLALPDPAKSRSAFHRRVDELVGVQLTAQQGQQLRAAADMNSGSGYDIPTADLWEMLDNAVDANKPKARKDDTPGIDGERPVDTSALDKELRKQLDRMGLHDVAVKAVPMMKIYIDTGMKARGVYKPLNKLIEIAFDVDHDPTETLNHEAIHALRDAGVITEGEWRQLASAAKATGFLNWAKAHYADEKPDVIVEESVAELFARWNTATASAHRPLLKRAGDKVRKFFKAIKAAFNGVGYQTAEQVMEDIRDGKIGRRARTIGRYDMARKVNAKPLARLDTKEIASDITDSFKEKGKQAIAFMAFTRDVASMAAKAGLPSAPKLLDAINAANAQARKLEQAVLTLKGAHEKLPVAEQKRVNKFVEASTRKEAWGYVPSYLPGVKVDADMKRQFDALTPAAQSVVKAAFAHGHTSLKLKQRVLQDVVRAEYDGMIADAKAAGEDTAALEKKREDALDKARILNVDETLPYAPLTRQGPRVVLGMSKEFAEARRAGDAKRMAELESDADHYFVHFVQSLAQAKKLAAQLKAGGYDETDHFHRQSAEDKLSGQEMFSAFHRLQQAVSDKSSKLDPKAAQQMKQLATEMYLTSLADTSARKSEIFRRKIASDDLEMMQNIVSNGGATARFVAAVQNQDKVLSAINGMKAELKDGKGDSNEKSIYLNEMLQRYVDEVMHRPSDVVDAIMRLNSLNLLVTSPGYYVQNATQTVLFSLPYMAGKYGYGSVSAKLADAYKQVMPAVAKANAETPVDLDNLPKDAKAVAQELELRGLLDTGIAMELGKATVPGSNRVSQAWNRIDRVFRLLPQNIETLNRLTAGLAAFRAARQGGATVEAAHDYAAEVVNYTHGDYSGFNTPRILFRNVGPARLAAQFKKFSIIQMTLMAKLLHNSFKGEDAKTRAVARKALAFTMGQMTLVSGIMGLPGAATFYMLGSMVNNMLGDDDPDDLEQVLRDMVGDGPLADTLIKGVPYDMGVDLSRKLGMGNMLELVPFTDAAKVSDREGAQAWVGRVAVGPTMAWVESVVDAQKRLQKGEYFRAIEDMAPKGIADLMKSYRLTTEGVTRTNGDELLAPEDIDLMTTMMTALGFQSKQLADQTAKSSYAYEVEEYFDARSKRLRDQYTSASPAKREELREAWSNLQDVREKHGYKRQPVSLLIKAERAQQKRERDTIGGVQTTRENRGFAEQLSR